MTDVEATVLLADDEPGDLASLADSLGASGYALVTAADGVSAWAMLQAAPARFDVVVLDRRLPTLDGIEVLQLMQQHPALQAVPVILQAAPSACDEVLAWMQAGAYYYLTKPFEEAMLRSVLRTAIADRRRHRQAAHDPGKLIRTVGLMREGTFSFRTLQSARDLAVLLASACPDPRRVVVGLTELLLNAVEHGNLGITYEEKGRLCECGAWDAEVAARLADPRYANRLVHVSYLRGDGAIKVSIRDEGGGFDYAKYLDIDPSRAFDTHGRGIAMARMVSFDSLHYRGCGNEVEVTVRTTADD